MNLHPPGKRAAKPNSFEKKLVAHKYYYTSKNLAQACALGDVSAGFENLKIIQARNFAKSRNFFKKMLPPMVGRGGRSATPRRRKLPRRVGLLPLA